MLKALELAGFKSFADRTRFEFPSGISVVVGPNGSGKSNIVDAVKWVLGSQSAKSLRGKEMIDVIFNGCASRGPLGTGEATLTFDNESGRLPIDAKEVHVSRRVYRSGEGEYLINRQPCRLRDVRELLAGTGITTEAYCIIEQGKVDALLQASPRDRRMIFEEAAGISQFKIKKAAAARRMERVEQNLLRLSDIVDEVESRLRSIRAQASKARRYRECTERLQQLRTEVGLVDWRTHTRQLGAREEQLAGVRRRVDEFTSRLETAESESRDHEQKAESAIHQLRELESAASSTREQIATCQATVTSQVARRDELHQEIEQLQEQLAAMTEREEGQGSEADDETSQLQAAEAELAEAETNRQSATNQLRESQRLLADSRAAIEELRLQLVEARRQIKLLADQCESLEEQVMADQSERLQLRQFVSQSVARRDTLAAELARHDAVEADLASQTAAHEFALRSADQRLVQVRRELTRADKLHRELEARLTRTRERVAVLTELEQRLDGLTGGVQEAVQLAQQSPGGPLSEMRGMVADLVRVDVDSAPLVEMALGERAQFIIMDSCSRLLAALDREPLGLGGRVGFLSLETRTPATALDQVDLSAEAGVMGRADRFVEVTPELEPLVRRMLGRTWLVDRLSTALRLSQTTGRGLEFVTSDGELLSADGTLIVGPRHAATGVLSRRSELRACEEQVIALERELTGHAGTHSQLDQERVLQEQQVAASVAAYTAAAGKLAECRKDSANVRAQLDRCTQDAQRALSELQEIEGRITEAEATLDAKSQEREEFTTAAGPLEAALAATQARAVQVQQQHAALETATTEWQIAAAKCEQRVEMLRHQNEQAERGVQERERVLADIRQRLESRANQVAELEQSIASGREVFDDLDARKKRNTEALASHTAAAEILRAERSQLAERIRAERQQQSAAQSQQHKLEVAIARLRHERQILCERMQDDYGIDLEQAASTPDRPSGELATGPGTPIANALGSSGTVQDRDAVEREIAELRNQINNIGAINLEALDELDALESRFATLSSQYQDLVDAKAALERVVTRINVDSRQLFVATLEAVRTHFQELFRRLFGGGDADIIVDEAEDILECGIEIVARPPGKEACSISLLSGGEKTLTCVALLLAVFRTKPSPFCVLDEVDAALDEANIGRFVGVLREFLSFTQFVVVSHSKRTMAGADTIYGVTMEESGVSKRVSVRFEDVSEDGHISVNALRRAA